MTVDPEKYRERLKKWNLDPGQGDWQETRILLPKDAYETVRRLARLLNMRVPLVMATLIEEAIHKISRDQDPAFIVKLPEVPPPVDDVSELTRLILASRFHKETSSTRFKYVSFVQFVASENLAGRSPTAISIARISGTNASMIHTFSRILATRGVLARVRKTLVDTGQANGKGAPTAKVLTVRPDAAKMFNAAHIEQTGKPIDVNI